LTNAATAAAAATLRTQHLHGQVECAPMLTGAAVGWAAGKQQQQQHTGHIMCMVSLKISTFAGAAATSADSAIRTQHQPA
jgi:hypothetical protein